MGAGSSSPEGPPEVIEVTEDISEDGAEAGFFTPAAAAAAEEAKAAAFEAKAALNLLADGALPLNVEAAAPSAAATARSRVADFRLGRVLGEGAFGKVRLATSAATGTSVAVKIIKRSRLKERAELLLAKQHSRALALDASLATSKPPGSAKRRSRSPVPVTPRMSEAM